MARDKRVPTKIVLTDYAENTSAHGIKKLTDNNGVLLKIVWLVLLLVAAGMIFFQVSQLIQLYLRHPVITKTTIESSPMKFPSVTFCNLNPVLNSKAKNDIIYEPVSKIASFLKIPLSRFDINVSDSEESDNYTFPDVDFNTNDPLDESLLEFQMELQSIPRDTLSNISQSFSKFVISCQFGGTDCDISNFTRTFDDDYGICYTFPNKTLMPQGLQVYNAGPLYGLKMILNVDQKEYVPFITSSAGVRIQIHEFGSKPHLTELGQSLSTGFETQIGVKPILHQRLGHPYGNCDDTGYFESVLDCERDCVEETLETDCNCTRRGQGTMPYCTSQDIPCIKGVIQKKQSGKLVQICSDCRSTCRVYNYEKQLSMTRWPASHYDPAVRFKLKKWSASEKADPFTEAESRDNLLTLNVYYSGLSLQTIEEEPAYEWESLLSDIGGQLGLWLGISVLSLCEVIELVYLLTRNCCKPRPKVSSTDD